MPTIAQYRAMLRTNRHRLDDELEIHAEIQEQINNEVNRAAARVREAEEKLKRIEARRTEELREAGDRGTMDDVKARVRRDPDRKEAWQSLQVQLSAHEEWSALLDAWRVKGYNIRDLALLYQSSYFALTEHQIRGRSERDSGIDMRRRIAEHAPRTSRESL